MLTHKHDASGTRAQILEAAHRLIASRGLAATTTKEIAREAACAEGTIYKHFRDKEDLFLTVFRERMPDFIDLVEELPERAGKGTVRRNLEEVGAGALRFFEAVVPALSSLFARPHLLEGYRAAMQRHGVGPFTAFHKIGEYLAAEQKLGRIDKRVDVDGATSLLMGSLQNYMFVTRTFGSHPSGLDPDRFVKLVVKTLYDGLAPRAKERK